MRQRADRNRGARGAAGVEIARVDLVEAFVVVHRNEEGVELDHVREGASDRTEDLAGAAGVGYIRLQGVRQSHDAGELRHRLPESLLGNSRVAQVQAGTPTGAHPVAG